MAYEKDPDYFSTADKLTLTGEKKDTTAWKKPTLSFGFQGYNPMVKLAHNDIEPITRDEWALNLVSLVFDMNGFFIFIESAYDVLNTDGESAFVIQIEGTKKVNGTYIVGEVEHKGSIIFGKTAKGIVYIEVHDKLDKFKRFKFQTPFRNKFSKNDAPFTTTELSTKYARGQLKQWADLATLYHAKYIDGKNKRNNQ